MPFVTVEQMDRILSYQNYLKDFTQELERRNSLEHIQKAQELDLENIVDNLCTMSGRDRNEIYTLLRDVLPEYDYNGFVIENGRIYREG